jgi:S-adenosylmethionine hydrolase
LKGIIYNNNIEANADEFSLQPGYMVGVKIEQQMISAAYGTIYSGVAQGKEIVFINNNLGVIQLSIDLGDFASLYGIQAGAKFEITK